MSRRTAAGRPSGPLGDLDRGQIVGGRILQRRASDPEAVRVAVGTAVFWARAVGGGPLIGEQRFEVLVPGERPVLRVVGHGGEDVVDLVVDASREKAHPTMGTCFDRHA